MFQKKFLRLKVVLKKMQHQMFQVFLNKLFIQSSKFVQKNSTKARSLFTKNQHSIFEVLKKNLMFKAQSLFKNFNNKSSIFIQNRTE